MTSVRDGHVIRLACDVVHALMALEAHSVESVHALIRIPIHLVGPSVCVVPLVQVCIEVGRAVVEARAAVVVVVDVRQMRLVGAEPARAVKRVGRLGHVVLVVRLVVGGQRHLTEETPDYVSKKAKAWLLPKNARSFW